VQIKVLKQRSLKHKELKTNKKNCTFGRNKQAEIERPRISTDNKLTKKKKKKTRKEIRKIAFVFN
jgi:hypothetical protein